MSTKLRRSIGFFVSLWSLVFAFLGIIVGGH